MRSLQVIQYINCGIVIFKFGGLWFQIKGVVDI